MIFRATCEKSISESKTFLGLVDVLYCSFCRQIISEAESKTARPSPACSMSHTAPPVGRI